MSDTTPTIGNHWASIKVNSQDEVTAYFKDAINKGVLEAEGNGYKILRLDLAPEIAVAAVCKEDGTPATVYPMARLGQTMPLKLYEVRPDKDGFPEAELICGYPDGPEIIFWDLHYAVNAHRYVVGETYDFVVGGISYKVEDVSNDGPIIIEDPQRIREIRTNRGDNPDDTSPLEFPMKGMASILPCNPDDPNWKYPEYVMRGPTTGFSMPSADSDYGRFDMVVSRVGPDYHDVGMTVACHRDHILSAPKNVGDDIFSLVWLQGHLAR